MALEPPPETTHPSEDTAYEAVRQWAQEHSYGVKKHRVKEDKNGVVQRRDVLSTLVGPREVHVGQIVLLRLS